jgi:hypothetical protein
MDVLQDTYNALQETSITSLLASSKDSIYHGWSEDAGTYPVIIFGIVSDVPALSCDNDEVAHAVTVRIHIVTKNGAYQQIYQAVQAEMKRLAIRTALEDMVSVCQWMRLMRTWLWI